MSTGTTVNDKYSQTPILLGLWLCSMGVILAVVYTHDHLLAILDDTIRWSSSTCLAGVSLAVGAIGLAVTAARMFAILREGDR